MKLLRDEKKVLFYEKEYESNKKKTLFKILLCVFIKTLFESFLQPLLPLYIINYYSIEVKELGILLSFYSFSQCVMCLIIGLLSSVNKKYLLIFLLTSNFLGIYLFYLKLNFQLLILNRIICGLSSVFIVVVNTIINELVEQKHVCRYFTYINIFNAIGIILGPLLSSLFLTIFNFRLILNFNVFGLLISLFIVISISSDILGKQDDNETNLKEGEREKNERNENDLYETIRDEEEQRRKVKKESTSPTSQEPNEYVNCASFSNASGLNKRENTNKKQKDKYILNKSALDNQTLMKKETVKNRNEKEERNSYFLEENESSFYALSYKKTREKYPGENIIFATSLYIIDKFNFFIFHCLSKKYKCLMALCLFRFTSAFASNLMSNIFFVFYNDNVTSDNKQIQISVFVSLSGIIMILYQYFSFSFILKHFGYDGTAIVGLLIQSVGILLTYHSIKFYNLIFQYISICFIHSCSYAYIEPIIPTIISSFFQKKDQLFCQSIVSFFRYLSLAISPIIYSYCYIENQFFPFFISSFMSIVSIFFVTVAFYLHKKMENLPSK